MFSTEEESSESKNRKKALFKLASILGGGTAGSIGGARVFLGGKEEFNKRYHEYLDNLIDRGKENEVFSQIYAAEEMPKEYFDKFINWLSKGKGDFINKYKDKIADPTILEGIKNAEKFSKESRNLRRMGSLVGGSLGAGLGLGASALIDRLGNKKDRK